MHYHLTLNGTVAPRARDTDEPTWRRYRPDTWTSPCGVISTLGLEACDSPMVTGSYAGDLCQRMARRMGLIILPSGKVAH
jgi:hypothetical protein